jgi:hypothetical protein
VARRCVNTTVFSPFRASFVSFSTALSILGSGRVLPAAPLTTRRSRSDQSVAKLIGDSSSDLTAADQDEHSDSRRLEMWVCPFFERTPSMMRSKIRVGTIVSSRIDAFHVSFRRSLA